MEVATYRAPVEPDDAEDREAREFLENNQNLTMETLNDTPAPTAEPEDDQEETKSIEPEPEVKAETQGKPDKAAKDESRFARNRRQFDEEKAAERAAIAAEKQAIAQERAALQAQRQQPAQKPAWQEEEEIDLTPAKPKFRGNKIVHGDQEYGVQELKAVINNSLANGDIAGAQQVAEVRDKLIARDTLYQYHQQSEAAKQEYFGEIEQTLKTRPELNDPNNPVAREALPIHQELERLYSANKRIPFNVVVGVGEALVKAAQVDAVTKERDALKARVQELEGKTALGGSPPSRKAAGSRSDDDMDEQEERDHVEKLLKIQFAGR